MNSFEYPVQIEWQGGRLGSGTVTPERSLANYEMLVPPEFGGEGGTDGKTNPEELLTSAIAGCYAITFGIIAANRKLPVVRTEMKAVGTVQNEGANFKYEKIVLRPRILLSHGATEAQQSMTMDMAKKTLDYCIVGNAVKGNVETVVEPTVEVLE